MKRYTLNHRAHPVYKTKIIISKQEAKDCYEVI